MKQGIGLLIGLSLIWACGDAEKPETPTVEEKPTSNDAPKMSKSNKAPDSSSGVSEAELKLLEPFLSDLREGIREFSPNSVGICEGQSKSCETFVGLDAGELAEGKYMIRGDFQAPKLKPESGWTIKFAVDCEITKISKNSTSTTTKNYAKEYTINHVNRTEYGYRLSPLYNIESPSSSGTHKCSWSITGANLDEPVVWKGSYTIPQK